MYRLPDNIFYNIYKIYYTNNVLVELKKNYKFTNYTLCLQCCLHGFPCTLCSDYVYNGKFGPGFEYNIRTLHKYNNFSRRSIININKWIKNNKNKKVHYIDYNKFKETLPQNIEYCNTFTQFFNESIDFYQNRSFLINNF